MTLRQSKQRSGTCIELDETRWRNDAGSPGVYLIGLLQRLAFDTSGSGWVICLVTVEMKCD